MKNIVVLYGGKSVEHEISILTGIQVLNAIDKKKYNVIPVYLTKDNVFTTGKNLGSVDKYLSGAGSLSEITFNRFGAKIKGKFKRIIKVDAVISCFHGAGVESGELAGYFDILNIPYTSSDVLSASICQDKVIMKKILKYDKIPVVPFIKVSEEDFKNNREKTLFRMKRFNYPVIIKPASLGSSIGIKSAKQEDEAISSILNCFKYDKKVIIERKLSSFREFNCAVLNKMVSSVEEVILDNEFLSFNDKYIDTKEKRVIPAQIDNDLENEIIDLSKKTYKALGVKGIARIDFLYDNDTSKLYVNEINTVPGALSYYLFEDKGIYFDELLDKLIDECIKDFNLKSQLLKTFPTNVLEISKDNVNMLKK